MEISVFCIGAIVSSFACGPVTTLGVKFLLLRTSAPKLGISSPLLGVVFPVMIFSFGTSKSGSFGTVKLKLWLTLTVNGSIFFGCLGFISADTSTSTIGSSTNRKSVVPKRKGLPPFKLVLACVESFAVSKLE